MECSVKHRSFMLSHLADNSSASEGGAGSSTDDTCAGRSQPLSEDIRRLAAPLSKEQLIDLVARASTLSPAVFKMVQSTALATPAARRIMVRNINYGTSDAQYTAHFAQFGPLEDAAIVREKNGRSKGFGFVTFANIESMRRCLGSPLHLDGRKLFVKVAADPFSEFLSDGAPIQSRMARRKIFVRNLPPDCDSDVLRDAFCQYGEVEECAVIRDPRGGSRGYGFITFTTQESAVKAAAEPQQTFNGRVIFVSVAKSTHRQVGGNAPQSPLESWRSPSNILYDPWTDNDCFASLMMRNGDSRSDKLACLYPYSAAAAAAAYSLIAADQTVTTTADSNDL